MFYSATYKIRVTTAAKDSAGNNIASQYTQTDGFKTTITIPTTAGSAHSCFMLDNGSVKCWGENSYGQLGLGDTINRGDNSSDMGDNPRPSTWALEEPPLPSQPETITLVPSSTTNPSNAGGLMHLANWA